MHPRHPSSGAVRDRGRIRLLCPNIWNLRQFGEAGRGLQAAWVVTMSKWMVALGISLIWRSRKA